MIPLLLDRFTAASCKLHSPNQACILQLAKVPKVTPLPHSLAQAKRIFSLQPNSNPRCEALPVLKQTAGLWCPGATETIRPYFKTWVLGLVMEQNFLLLCAPLAFLFHLGNLVQTGIWIQGS